MLHSVLKLVGRVNTQRRQMQRGSLEVIGCLDFRSAIQQQTSRIQFSEPGSKVQRRPFIFPPRLNTEPPIKHLFNYLSKTADNGVMQWSVTIICLPPRISATSQKLFDCFHMILSRSGMQRRKASLRF